LQNQPWVKKRNLSVSTESPAALTAASSTLEQRPPPQLAYQKSQWDAQRDIPRGLVAQKVAGQQQKLREQHHTVKPRVTTNTTTTTSSSSNQRLPALVGRTSQTTSDGRSSPNSTINSAPTIPTLDDSVIPVQPPPSPRHARQLSPNYNNGKGNHLDKDERLWGASSTSPRLAAAAIANANKSSSSPRHAKTNNSFVDRKVNNSNSNNKSSTNARQQAPFPDRQQQQLQSGSTATNATTAPSDIGKLVWNVPAFSDPPPPPCDDSPELNDYQQKHFHDAISPTNGNNWQPKVASPKGRLTNNFFVQADSPRRSDNGTTTIKSLDPSVLNAIPGPRMFWGDESLDEERDDGFHLQEPEPVQSPSRSQRLSEAKSAVNDSFTDLRSPSTTVATTSAQGDGGTGWPSKRTSGAAPQAASGSSWPTSRFMDDEVDWFEKGHVFSTDTNESASLQNSAAEQKALLGGSRNIRSSSSGGAFVAEELEEKKIDEMTTTTTSPRSLGSPEELATLAPRKSKTFPPPEGKKIDTTASSSLAGAVAKSPTKGWLMTNTADSGSKSVDSSNANASVEDDAAAPMNPPSNSITIKETGSKKNRFGILNIFGTVRYKV
jgi:hypothetical protein